ncbi:hypothetical protein BHE74_00003006 [Ensete ventricosum]|nr:hypothetical protein GW17_00010254 [Ensete ventricosum]RWW88128.1 hypothetical protein BHE74_00003006 [Ensete ventricosum]
MASPFIANPHHITRPSSVARAEDRATPSVEELPDQPSVSPSISLLTRHLYPRYFHARRSLSLLAVPSTMPPLREALDQARKGSCTARLRVDNKSRLACKPSSWSSSSFPLLAAAAATNQRHPVITHARATKMIRTGRSSFTELVQNLTGRPCTDESCGSRLCTRHGDRHIGKKRADMSSSFHTTAPAAPLL